MIVKIYIENEQLDLFSDENISITQNVASIEDITRNLTDFTKDFTVPASDNNNRIFKHYYDANITNTFDARVKVEARIELDGMPFKKGKVRLQKVNVKQNKPSSYTIVFWGLGTSLKDIIGDDKLNTLDWSNENHDFDSDTVRTGLFGQIGLYTIYTPLAKRQFYYNSNPADSTDTDVLVNIAYQGGAGNNGIKWDELKPSIRLIRIIELVEQKYDIEFTRDFFGKPEFDDLFFWCNNKENKEYVPSAKLIDWSAGSSPYVDTATDIGTFPLTNIDYFEFTLNIIPDFSYENIPYTLSYYVDGNLSASWNLIGEQSRVVNLSSSQTENKEAYFTISSNQNFSFQGEWEQLPKKLGGADGTQVGNVAFDTTSSEFIVADNVPDIKIIDFLRGIFNMFKLIVDFRGDKVYVDTFNRYYELGNLYDVSDYIDYNSVDVSRGTILREINYKFEEPSTILNLEYEENNSVAYGDIDFELKDENGKQLDGDQKEYKVPFEQIVYERLNDVSDNEQTEFMYGLVTDRDIKGVTPKMHIHYKNRKPQIKQIGFINDVGVKEDLTNINMPTHVDSIDSPLFSTTFETNVEEYSGNVIERTLYSNYHANYISSVFNSKRRKFNYSAVLPLLVMLEIQLNDTLKIGSDFYRVNSITTDLTTNKSTLDLINSFETVSQGFTANPTEFFISDEAQQLTSFVTNLGEYTYNKIDNGSGVDWVTVSDNTTDLLFDVDKNNGDTRDIFIIFTSETTLETFTIYIQQSQSTVLASSDTVTADSNEITADNG